MRKGKEMLKEAIIMKVLFSIPQFPQHTGQLVSDSGKKDMKRKSKSVVTSVIQWLLGCFSYDSSQTRCF